MAGETFVDGDERFPIPPLSELVDLHERMACSRGRRRCSRSRSTRATLDEAAARAAVAEAEAETGLPADDPVRFGASEARGRAAAALER